MVDLHFSLLVAILKAELDVLAYGLAFLLGKARHNRQEHLALSIQRVYGFFFRKHTYYFQLPSLGSQVILGVSVPSRRGLTNTLILDIASAMETGMSAFFFFKNEFHRL